MTVIGSLYAMLEEEQLYDSTKSSLIFQDLISYTLLSRSPFSVEECNVGSGATCGAVFLRKSFDRFLREKLGTRVDSILTKDRLDEALDWFESNVKISFNPYDESFDWNRRYRLPMHGVLAEDQAALGIQGGYLKLTACEFIRSSFLTLSGTRLKQSFTRSSSRFSSSSKIR